MGLPLRGRVVSAVFMDEVAATHAQMMDAVRAHNERQIVALVRGLLDLADTLVATDLLDVGLEDQAMRRSRARALLRQARDLGIL